MEYDSYKEVETLKASIWKKVFATISFWVLIFFGGSVVMLWNAISPSMAQYRPGDLGYTVLQIISTGVGSVLAVLALDSITKSKCQLLCAINCTISATFMGVLIALNILLKNGNVSRYISVGFAFAILIYFAVGLLTLAYYLLWMTGILDLWPDAFVQCYPLRLWFATLSTAGNELLRLGPLFLSGGLLFLALNR